MTEIGNLLKELRGERTLRSVERGANLSNAYLSRIENGTSAKSGEILKPSPEVLRKLADYYNHPYHDLMIKAGYLTLTDNDKANEVILQALENPNILFNKKELNDYILEKKYYDLETNIKSSNYYKNRKLSSDDIDLLLTFVRLILR